ncbi:MAG: DUF6103 family protein [Pygmaiobacter massiliensis]|nr:DUF6103 family protein [Pygmaiobacter massiliensis]
MKKENITLSMEGEKLRAIKRYMGKKDVTVEQELADALQKFYEKYVPAPVREYIDEPPEDVPASNTVAKKQKEKSKPDGTINGGEYSEQE